MEVQINGNLDLVAQGDEQSTIAGGAVMVTPPLDENYWILRVPLSKAQAVVCFPKFGVIGIGFAKEDEDWNTNLPSTCKPEEIRDHIICNKGDPDISDSDVLAAIVLLQEHIKKLGLDNA